MTLMSETYRPHDMVEAVAAIVAIARVEEREEDAVYQEKRVEWTLPTQAPWPILREFPYA